MIRRTCLAAVLAASAFATLPAAPPLGGAERLAEVPHHAEGSRWGSVTVSDALIVTALGTQSDEGSDAPSGEEVIVRAIEFLEQQLAGLRKALDASRTLISKQREQLTKARDLLTELRAVEDPNDFQLRMLEALPNLIAGMQQQIEATKKGIEFLQGSIEMVQGTITMLEGLLTTLSARSG